LRVVSLITGNMKMRRVACWASLVGSLLTRFGWVQADHASATDHRVPLQLPEKVKEIRQSSHELAA